MLKLIHAADIHLGSKLDSRFPYEISNTRKKEILSSFNRLIEYAKDNDIKHILLSGDVFDSDKPFKKDKDFFYSAVKHNPDINFYYLRGNHDIKNNQDEEIENLHLFNDSWTKYDIGNVKIYGIELDKNNETSLYSLLNPNLNEFNIVMLHGDINSINKKDSIDLSKLKNKPIDYIALGHIHSSMIDKISDRTTISYPGILDGRGFDEIGPKGFNLIKIDDNKLQIEFIEFESRMIKEVNFDVSTSNDFYELIDNIKTKISFSKKDIYRLNLVGNTKFDNEDLVDDIKSQISNLSFYLDIKDKTSKVINYDEYRYMESIEGEFVRNVLADSTLSDEDKNLIISLGLKALNGGGID